MTENTDGLADDTPYCTECDAPLDAADAHMCRACIAEDDFNAAMNQFDSDPDAYLDWVLSEKE